MGCEFKTKIKLDYIQDFEMMFERMRINRPREAAIYYGILIIDSPKEFSDYLKIAEELANISRRPLETGRSSLLKNGRELAVNGIKILHDTDTEPSYIGTAYVNLEEVEILNDKFNNLWNLAKPFKITNNIY